jgi:hypothetical protein
MRPYPMRPSLLSRLERLEARKLASKPLIMTRLGYLARLSEDFLGERHVVIVKREPTGSPYEERCDFAERPGPAPPGSDDGIWTIYLTR